MERLVELVEERHVARGGALLILLAPVLDANRILESWSMGSRASEVDGIKRKEDRPDTAETARSAMTTSICL